LAASGFLQRIVEGRGLGQSGQQSSFGQAEIGGGFVEVGLGRGFDAVGQMAVVDLVEVEFQNGVFVVAPGDLGSEDGLFDLAGHGAFGRQEDEFDQLLADGAGSGHGGAAAQRADNGFDQADGIDAGVFVEVGVFGGDGGLDEVGRDPVDGDAAAQAGCGIAGGQRLLQDRAGAVVDAGGLEVAGALFQLGGGGQVAGHGRVAEEEGGQGQENHDEEEQDAEQEAVETAAVAIAGRFGTSRRPGRWALRLLPGPVRLAIVQIMA